MSAGALPRAQPNALNKAQPTVGVLWDGNFTQTEGDFVPPTWESLPSAVRRQLAGRDTLPGPSVASFVLPSVTQRRGTEYVEVRSGWLLHERGVFFAHAERPLMPIARNRYHPAGEWNTSFRQATGAAFRFKHGVFAPEHFDSSGGEAGAPADLMPLWLTIPARPRSLLGDNLSTSRDHGDWWVISRGRDLRMTLCYQRESPGRTCAVIQTRCIATSGDASDPKQLAGRLARAPWDVCAFAAEFGASQQVASVAQSAAALKPPGELVDEP